MAIEEQILQFWSSWKTDVWADKGSSKDTSFECSMWRNLQDAKRMQSFSVLNQAWWYTIFARYWNIIIIIIIIVMMMM